MQKTIGAPRSDTITKINSFQALVIQQLTFLLKAQMGKFGKTKLGHMIDKEEKIE